MKKIIILFMVFSVVGCVGVVRHAMGKFEYIVIRKSLVENPSFSVYVEGYDYYNNVWLKERIENALMQQKVSVLLFNNSKQLVTTTSGKEKNASTQDNSGTKLHKGNIDITSITEFQSQVKANYLVYANYGHWTFSVISMKNQEIIAKGTFTSLYVDDIKSNVKTILNEMGIFKELTQ